MQAEPPVDSDYLRFFRLSEVFSVEIYVFFVTFHVCSRRGKGGNYNQAGTTVEPLNNETNLKKEEKSRSYKRYVVANFCQKKFKSKI